jgi:hypothetical protein
MNLDNNKFFEQVKASDNPKEQGVLCSKDLLAAVKRLVDYEANNLLYWFNECQVHDHAGNETQRIYQANYNTLVSLREKLTLESLPQFLDRQKFDMPEALKPIYIKAANAVREPSRTHDVKQPET